VPGTCLEGFIDFKGLGNKFLESRLTGEVKWTVSVYRELGPMGRVERGSVTEFSTGGWVSEPDASLQPFFDLHNVAIKAVKTDLPFIVSFIVDYA